MYVSPPVQRLPPLPPPSGPHMPRWLDVGLLVIGVGTLLIFIGFIFGAAAGGQFNGGTAATLSGDLEAFFVVTGFGILVVVGGWLYRVVMIARRGRP